MFTIKKSPDMLTGIRSENTLNTIGKDFTTETGTLEVIGTGEIRIINTGGSSASEGGMGSDSEDDKVKGDITESGEAKSGNSKSDEDDPDTAFDPIKKNVREKERESGRD